MSMPTSQLLQDAYDGKIEIVIRDSVNNNIDITVIEDLLSCEAIEEICQSGSNDSAVKKWLNHYLHELGELNICPAVCKNMVEYYGFSSPVENNLEWMERALWCAAWNVFETREGE